ncbi:MAG TPA: hypothetical protein PK514_02180 [Spirochaetota bacterium]|nr:hypothetical protein [Spirochaetota bacterium]
MIKHIDIVDGERREQFSHRFISQVRRFRYIGFMVIMADAALTALLVTSYVTGKSTKLALGMSMAMVALLTVPFMIIFFNKSWQLGADAETDHLQVLTGRVEKIKKEVKGKKTYLVLTVDKQNFTINEEYCKGVDVGVKVAITVGISSKVAVDVAAVEQQ